MERIYLNTLQEHLAHYRQMVFLTGPRQVGKTTLSKQCAQGYEYKYFNWDHISDKELILSGAEKLYQKSFGEIATDKPRVIILDEIHKYPQWKALVKGYFDTLENKTHWIITGSAKLDIYRRGGDSMMGRYFSYRVHPLSVAESIGRLQLDEEVTTPGVIGDEKWEALLKFGGFPEPFLAGEETFYRRWQNLKNEQLFREDLRELTKVHDLARLQLFANLLAEQVSGTVNYSAFSKKVRVSEPTIRNWLDILTSVYYCFTIKPWSSNVARSLIKEPKVYLWDWSMAKSKGARIENLVANHLLKATHWWTDIGLGHYELFYLRDKEKREVDFLICKNNIPWLMVEVKSSANQHVSPHLHYFCQQLSPLHTVQLAYDLPYKDIDCFSLSEPLIVPMRTFLSQLV